MCLSACKGIVGRLNIDYKQSSLGYRFEAVVSQSIETISLFYLAISTRKLHDATTRFTIATSSIFKRETTLSCVVLVETTSWQNY